ncbi:LOW QUALITY PROTEIN: phosphate regulon transcriptional regulatory protein PhoB [Geomicrobium sp. JCM 19055]|nr:LOW QUALITY PROTEIN: phosphate regulon transcriptional regulatory protein PhoB [Geomicrobium sp. JCM 19055]
MEGTILIVDDDREISELVSYQLRQEGYSVLIAGDGKEALHLVSNHIVDLIILDVMMPEVDGFQVAKTIREKKMIVPIIFLSAKTSDFDKVQGLVIGADDYMTKPFKQMELIARVNAHLRRYKTFHQQTATEGHVLSFGDLEILVDEHRVNVAGDEIVLTPKEFAILVLLATHPKKVFSAERILNRVWGIDEAYGTNTVMVHIRTLRKKIKEPERRHKLIKTVWGVGYTFNG